MAASASIPWNEEERLRALYRYGLLDTLPERAFDDLAMLAAQICRAPVSLVSLMDRNRQWFKAHIGVEIQETPRDIAFCAYTILQNQVLVVPDARKDPRFCNNPFVTGAPYIRFYAGAPLITADGYAVGTICVLDTVPRRLRKAQQEALAALARQVVSQMELRLQTRKLQQLATTDARTEVGNVRALREQLDRLFLQARNSGCVFSLIMLDIDHFKSYNDTYGHPQGDIVLQTIASILKANLRTSDIVGRYGGEEFMIILPNTDQANAFTIAERLRKAIAEYPWPLRPITASFGIATYHNPIQKPEALVEEADQALYIAKRLGRNRVILSEQTSLYESIREQDTLLQKTDRCSDELNLGLEELASGLERSSSKVDRQLRIRFYKHLQRMYNATIEGWSRILDLRDKETEGHSQRVTELTVQLARQMGLPEKQLVYIRWGALLHDIGKIGIPDSILHKPGPLTEDEWAVMRRHPEYAYEMLSNIPFLKPALDIPYCHHERWDGSGYPRGLRGEEIPLAARIFAVIDVWDALRSDRPYRKGWSEERALEYLCDQAGHHFDPEVVEQFLCMIGKTSYIVEPRKAA